MIPVNLIAPILGLALFVAAAGGAYWKGMTNERAEWEAKAAQSKIAAQDQEAIWAKNVTDLKVQHEKDKARLSSNLRIALDGLRDRPAVRLPEAARAACNGSTGAELARGDAVFLAGYSADAAALQADLKACKEYIRVITESK